MLDGYLLASVGRLIVGAVFLGAGMQKARSPRQFAHSLRSYGFVPASLVGPVSHGLPALEVLTGAGLVAGVLARPFAVLSVLLLLVFISATALALRRGAKVDCGCFGATKGHVRSVWSLAARDSGLTLALVPVIIYGSGYGSVANLALPGQIAVVSAALATVALFFAWRSLLRAEPSTPVPAALVDPAPGLGRRPFLRAAVTVAGGLALGSALSGLVKLREAEAACYGCGSCSSNYIWLGCSCCCCAGFLVRDLEYCDGYCRPNCGGWRVEEYCGIPECC